MFLMCYLHRALYHSRHLIMGSIFLSFYLPTSFFPHQPNIGIVDGLSHSNLILQYKPPPPEAAPSGSSPYPLPNILPRKCLSKAFAAKPWLLASTIDELPYADATEFGRSGEISTGTVRTTRYGEGEDLVEICAAIRRNRPESAEKAFLRHVEEL
ncbi:hypothetical protein BDP27DRAFT_1429746 [Rhodocollybia butyracea]|uniref:Uncharacterized protein n=1 Tax=Rhodocollybia butyracea TaxID=206335 RepID=A0A9P5PC50_9AGAR|nr:hypothetical protein BDP27DRAFT_1429746 [Rhodocollybia butyracea]